MRKRQGVGALMPLLFVGISVAVAGMPVVPCNHKQAAIEISLQRIVNEWPMRGSGESVSQYVQKLGVRLAFSSLYGRNIPWRFSVVRNLAPNAFSIGGGYVFITDGSVNFVRNESELAAILAHELGHELAGHFCAAPDLIDFGGLFDIFSAPKAQQHQVGVGSLTQVINPVKEQQADQIAVTILQANGYDPHAMLEVARRLPKGDGRHPMDFQRLQALESLLAKIPPIKAQDSEDFLTIKRTLAAEQAAW